MCSLAADSTRVTTGPRLSMFPWPSSALISAPRHTHRDNVLCADPQGPSHPPTQPPALPDRFLFIL